MTQANHVRQRTRVLAGLLSASDGSLRITIVSQRAAMRYGLRHLLTQHVRGGEFVALSADPDLVVYDLSEVDEAHVANLEKVVTTTQAVVIAVSLEAAADLAAMATAAAEAGADGFFSFGLSEDDWLDTVGSALIDGASRSLQSRSTGSSQETVLTQREIDVLTLIAHGRNNKEIADELGLSANTVKTYIRTAYKKIGVTSRAQALGWMVSNGLISGMPGAD